jgi:hypothetical protein
MLPPRAATPPADAAGAEEEDGGGGSRLARCLAPCGRALHAPRVFLLYHFLPFDKSVFGRLRSPQATQRAHPPAASPLALVRRLALVAARVAPS